MLHNDIDVLVWSRWPTQHRNVGTVSEIILSNGPVDIDDVNRSLGSSGEWDLEMVLRKVFKTVKSVLVIIQSMDDCGFDRIISVETF